MESIWNDLGTALPELYMLGMVCFVLVFDLFLPAARRDLTYWLVQLTLAGAFVLTLAGYDGGRTVAFDGHYVVDEMAVLLKSAIYLIAMAVFLYSRPYLKDRGLFRGEYFVLGLFGVLGMMIMVSAHSFLSLYLGLELLALSQYAMVAFFRDSLAASEAAMKYFVLGALASGMLLYGMSVLYGTVGSLDIATVARALSAEEGRSAFAVFGLVFMVVGIAFKFGAVPFHMWVPDVYDGAPTSVTLYIGSAPKIAAFAMLMRLLAESLGPLTTDWGQLLAVLLVLSMAVGNVIAIAQRRIKRMLAYSTISHVGFLFFGAMAGTQEGYAASMFYAIVYAAMAAGAFGMLLLLSRQGYEPERIDDFKGLNERHPWLAFMMLLLMFSMAGVPPTVGFYAKLAVIQAAVNVGEVWIAVYAVVLSVIGAFYYLRIVKFMYFDKPEEAHPVRPGMDAQVVMGVNGLSMLVLGLFPGGLMALCLRAVGY
jgi:NADH-quinone oxidoreductase subunit N